MAAMSASRSGVVGRRRVDRLDGDESGERQAELVGVDPRGVAADHPAGLQSAYPLVDGGHRQADPLREVGVTHATVVDEGPDYPPVELFHTRNASRPPPPPVDQERIHVRNAERIPS